MLRQKPKAEKLNEKDKQRDRKRYMATLVADKWVKAENFKNRHCGRLTDRPKSGFKRRVSATETERDIVRKLKRRANTENNYLL